MAASNNRWGIKESGMKTTNEQGAKAYKQELLRSKDGNISSRNHDSKSGATALLSSRPANQTRYNCSPSGLPDYGIRGHELCQEKHAIFGRSETLIPHHAAC